MNPALVLVGPIAAQLIVRLLQRNETGRRSGGHKTVHLLWIQLLCGLQTTPPHEPAALHPKSNPIGDRPQI